MSTPNPHFNQIERAPYELGHLFRKLPYDFPADQAMPSDQRQQVEAVISHAWNANYTLMNGIEAIGQLLFTAANSKGNPTDASVFADIGTLIKHLAVEAHFLQEQQFDLQAVLDRDERRAATSPLRQKSGAKVDAAASGSAA